MTGLDTIAIFSIVLIFCLLVLLAIYKVLVFCLLVLLVLLAWSVMMTGAARGKLQEVTG